MAMTDTETIEYLVIALARALGVPESVVWLKLGRKPSGSIDL